jgi:uncharacterized protein (DUF1499 family)
LSKRAERSAYVPAFFAILRASQVFASLMRQFSGRNASSNSEDKLQLAPVHIDLYALKPPKSPNCWLVAPLDFDAAQADQRAPVFEETAHQLARAWMTVVQNQPRAAVLGTSEDGLQIEAQQRSAVFGFIDRISTRFLQLASGRSTIIAYSRSQVGYWDLGVNRRRLRRWLSKLATQVEKHTE